jgi:DNA-binding transcriptional regulator YiaG
MDLIELFPGRVGLNTCELARVLNRRPQTLRRWACFEDGPIRPQRINGRLLWLISDAQLLFAREVAK